MKVDKEAVKNFDSGERKEIREKAKESAEFVRKGGDPRDLPKHLNIYRR